MLIFKKKYYGRIIISFSKVVKVVAEWYFLMDIEVLYGIIKVCTQICIFKFSQDIK